MSKIKEKDKKRIARYHNLKYIFDEEVHKDLAPMFYHTLTYEGDKEKRDEMLELEKDLKKESLI